MVSKLAEAVQAQHGICAQQAAPAEAGTITVEEALEVTLKRTVGLETHVEQQRRKIRKLQTDNELLRAEAERGVEAVAAARERGRQESRQESRRHEISSENTAVFTRANKSTAMTTPATGVLACIKYWSEGSAMKVLQLIMALISTFCLQELVAVELGLQHNETNQYIVDRLGDSLRVLRQCRSEEQRQHFRVVLTAVAPKKVGCRRRGMSRRVAEALHVNRNSKPFRDSVDKRAKIDEAAEHMDDPLAVGDAVVCRHGAGILTECAGPDHVVAVRWLERLTEDPELRTFELKPNAPQDVFNSTELRCVDVQLDKENGQLAPVRRSARANSQRASQAIARAIRYVVPTEVEQMILVDCW
jgi:hypothetical protein